MKRRGEWTRAFSEVFYAIRADPMLLAPAILTIIVAVAVAFAVLFFGR